MAGFVFKLEALLSYRRHRRDLCRHVLAQVLANERWLQTQRRRLQTERLAQLQELRRLGDTGAVDIDRAAARRYYAGQLVADIAKVEQNQQLVARQLESCRRTLVQADQDVKVLEKLKEKQRAEFAYQQDRRAARELEDAWSASRWTGAMP